MPDVFLVNIVMHAFKSSDLNCAFLVIAIGTF